ncbi:MAG: ParA family protein [Candidatus Krumholzibacteriota bacterium]|nr:ParA family protein [Candidatus Krumholzibacteriota bacterium]
MGRAVAVVCPKGGVGKTTVTVNLASALADMGFHCLLIGVDPQCGLLSSFGRDRFAVDYGLLDFFDPEGDPARVVQSSTMPNLDFITSNVWSREEEAELIERAGAEPERLAASLADYRGHYDFLFLDCPPNMGPLTAAALRAADAYLVPMQAEELAYHALPRLFDAVDELARGGAPMPELMGIVLNQVDERTRLASNVIERVRDDYGEQVFQTMIPRTVRLAEVAQRGLPVNLFNRSGAGARAFAALAEEILAAPARPAERLEREAALAGSAGASFGTSETRVAAPFAVEAAARDGADRDEADRFGGEPVISLDEIDESGAGAGPRSLPSLDDYDGVGDEDRYH